MDSTSSLTKTIEILTETIENLNKKKQESEKETSEHQLLFNKLTEIDQTLEKIRQAIL
jgi:predicted nucleic acid-binding protein